MTCYSCGITRLQWRASASNDLDCKKVITLVFCIKTCLLANRTQQTSTNLQCNNSLD